MVVVVVVVVVVKTLSCFLCQVMQYPWGAAEGDSSQSGGHRPVAIPVLTERRARRTARQEVTEVIDSHDDEAEGEGGDAIMTVIREHADAGPWGGTPKPGLSSSSNRKIKAAVVMVAILCITYPFDAPFMSGIALRIVETSRDVLGWSKLSDGVYRAFLEDLQVMDGVIDDYKGKTFVNDEYSDGTQRFQRGIVVPAGGKDQLFNAFVNVFVLRNNLRCELPVTIAYWGDLEKERIDQTTMDIFGKYVDNVSFLDLATLSYPKYHRKVVSPSQNKGSFNGFKVKVFALYAAPYEQVLLMDSDSMATQDPTELFDHPEYVKKGNMFWPDRWCTGVELFALLGVDQKGGYQTDSGQFFFDRRMHPDVLEWALFLNTHDEFTYRYAHGDKDTYRAAFHLAKKGAEYYQVKQPLSVAVSASRPLLPFFERPPTSSQKAIFANNPQGFVQHHPNRSIAFVHRTSKSKYTLRSGAGRTFSHILLQPSCIWNRKYWHFSRPMMSVRRHGVASSVCNVTWNDITASISRCENLCNGHPLVMQVDPASYVSTTQYAAEQAALLYRDELGDVGTRRNGGTSVIAYFFVCIFLLYVCSLAVRSDVASWVHKIKNYVINT